AIEALAVGLAICAQHMERAARQDERRRSGDDAAYRATSAREIQFQPAACYRRSTRIAACASQCQRTCTSLAQTAGACDAAPKGLAVGCFDRQVRRAKCDETARAGQRRGKQVIAAQIECATIDDEPCRCAKGRSVASA